MENFAELFIAVLALAGVVSLVGYLVKRKNENQGGKPGEDQRRK